MTHDDAFLDSYVETILGPDGREVIWQAATWAGLQPIEIRTDLGLGLSLEGSLADCPFGRAGAARVADCAGRISVYRIGFLLYLTDRLRPLAWREMLRGSPMSPEPHIHWIMRQPRGPLLYDKPRYAVIIRGSSSTSNPRVQAVDERLDYAGGYVSEVHVWRAKPEE